MRTGTVSYKLEDLKKGVIIPIGFVGENDFTRVIFDAEEIYKKYPSASVSMKVQPPKGVIYPAAVTRDGNTVIWQVKEADVANRGCGELQLTFIDGETKIKTYIAKTDVKRSLAGNGPAPDPVQDWVDNAEEVLDDLEAMDTIAKNAQAGDIGKALSPKTVENGVVTEWQYVEPGGGTEDYDDLDNKPSIAGVTLSGNKTLEDLGIAADDDLDNLANEVSDVKNAIQGVSTDVSFLENYITPQMKGAKADGLTDDTTAINAAAAEAIEKSMMLYIPQGQYKCESGLNLRCVKRIRSEGVITLTTDDTWVTVGDSSVNGIFCDIHIASATRVKVVGLLDSKVYVGYAQELMLYADGEDDDGHAVAYNTLQGEFVSKITLMSNKESETVGWVNDNLFEFRRIIHILIDGNYKHNNNVFRNCGIEGNAATIDIPMGHSNKIICRGESLPLTNITIGADCFNNQILKSWGNPGLTGGYLDHMIDIQRKNYYGMIWDQLRTYYSIINIDRNHKCSSGMQGYLDDNGKMYAYSGQTFVKVDKYVIPNASQVEVVLSASDARFSLKNVQLHGADGTALQLSASIVEGGGINSYYGQTTAQFTSGAYRLLNFTITDPETVRYISFELITTSGYSGNFEFVTVKFVTNKIFTYNPIMAPIEIKSYANAAPLRGNWEVGEIVYNASPAPGGYVGWICTTAGKSGTWKGFGLIEA